MRYGIRILAIQVFMLGCSQNQENLENNSYLADTIGLEECQSCGMVVRDQPAPRGQVVHRDGTRAFFCSISDMVLYMETPSPHGKIQQSYVEVMDQAANPKNLDNSELEWASAEMAGYVLGFPRKGIMGEPVLVYKNNQIAVEVAETHDGEAVNLSQLRQKIIQDQGS